MTFSPRRSRPRAIAAIQDWYLARRGASSQVFRLFGYAGSGKSTHHRAMPSRELGLDAEGRDGGRGGVLYAAFTGKAALVMTRKGTPASTIHSLIYRVSEATPEEIARGRAGARRPARQPRQPWARPSAVRRGAAPAPRAAPRDLHQPRFVLNEQSLLRDADLLVLDEVSMVGAEMAADLLAFGKPILVLGDPGQLPPIKGEGAFTDAAPDVMLTEIHRQAGESADRPPRHHGAAGRAHPVRRARRLRLEDAAQDVAPEQLLNGGQVICGRNATRRILNAAMKQAAGFRAALSGGPRREDHLPQEPQRPRPGQRHVPRARRHPGRGRPLLQRRRLATEDGEAVPGRQRFYKGHFDDHVSLDPDRDRARLDMQARADRDRLGLRHHLPQGAGLAVAERHRLSTTARPHRRGPGPLALHRDHARRARAGDP